ncbi:DinB family protein [Metabacillus sp. cB07]|uniref:DinB family protein n=1 Tax=Metabacillus sp. cB07 TaxID=2806989 RepID=UPI00193A46A7|nr:DinB family protein [Metabacillus sp. cB07]
MNTRPEQNEFPVYYKDYIGLVPEGDIEYNLKHQISETLKQLNDLSEEEGTFKYAPGKWSIKEIIGHITDTERIMAYRMLSIARGEAAELPGFDENEYVAKADFNKVSMDDLLQNLFVVREATLLLFKTLGDPDWKRTGIACGQTVSVRAIAYIIAGHELHHRRILADRYLIVQSVPKSF